MKLAVMQPYLFPYIGYFQLINKVDVFVVYDNVKYVKRGWINRNKLRASSVKAEYFTLPLEKASHHLDIVERKIHKKEFIRFKLKLLNRVHKNYSKADYYLDGLKIIESCLDLKADNLFKFINYSIKRINDYLDINTSMAVSSNLPVDHNLKAQDRVLSICKNYKCSEYWNVYAGLKLYKFKDFSDQNVRLYFLKSFKNILYDQKSDNFISNLSILDVIMHNSKDRIRELLKKYHVIDSECYTN